MAALLVILSVFIVMTEGSHDCLTIESCAAITTFEDPQAVALRNLNNYVTDNLPYCYGHKNCSVINPLNMDEVHAMYEHLYMDPVPIYIGDLVLVTAEEGDLLVAAWPSTITAFIPQGLNQVYGMIQFHYEVNRTDLERYLFRVTYGLKGEAVPFHVYMVRRDIARKYFDEGIDILKAGAVLTRIGTLSLSVDSGDVDCGLFHVNAQTAAAFNSWFDVENNVIYDDRMIYKKIKKSSYDGACLSGYGWFNFVYIELKQETSIQIVDSMLPNSTFEGLSGSLCVFKDESKYILTRHSRKSFFVTIEGDVCVKEITKSDYRMFDEQIYQIDITPLPAFNHNPVWYEQFLICKESMIE